MKKILFIIFLFVGLCASAQVDTTKPIQKINGNGFAWKTTTADSAAMLPQDTFRLKSTWRGIAFKGTVPYYWTGTKWEVFGTGGGLSRLGPAGVWLVKTSDSTYAVDTPAVNAYYSTKFVPFQRTISINGVTLDLSANRSFTIGHRFGLTGEDVTATGARAFDANLNAFTIKRIKSTGQAGFFSGTTNDINSAGAGAFYGFGDDTEGAAWLKMGTYNNFIKINEFATEKIILNATSGGHVSTIEIGGGGQGININPGSGYLNIDSLIAFSGPLSGHMLLWNGTVYSYLIDSFKANLGFVPFSRTITINGITYDLSANRSWTINGDFYTLDGTFSSPRRGNLNGYRLTLDSGQVRYRDTMTSATGKLYGGIYDYGRAGAEHINYDSLLTAYYSMNALTGVKFGVRDQNDLDTNVAIQVDATGARLIGDTIADSDSSDKLPTTKWVKRQGFGSGSADGITYTAASRTLAIQRSSLADISTVLPLATTSAAGLMDSTDKKRLDSNSYIHNEIVTGYDTLTRVDVDTLKIKAVKFVSDDGIQIDKEVTNSTLKFTIGRKQIGEPIATFNSGAGIAGDTTIFTDSTLYGSFFTGQDSIYLTGLTAVLKGQVGDTIGIKIVWNDSINVDGTIVDGTTYPLNSRTTGNSFNCTDNAAIPPNSWVWIKSPTVIAGKKPEYLSITLIGYRRYVIP